MIAQVNNLIQKTNDYADRAKDLENRATDYLQKYINKTINFIASGRILEPILLVNAKDGIHRRGWYLHIPSNYNEL